MEAWLKKLGIGAVNPGVFDGKWRGDAVVESVSPIDGKVIARGWTQPGGRPHAEAVVLTAAGDAAHGATLYVTLEPCAHVSERGPRGELCARRFAGVDQSERLLAFDGNVVAVQQKLDRLLIDVADDADRVAVFATLRQWKNEFR